jgi:hypothetical protein
MVTQLPCQMRAPRRKDGTGASTTNMRVSDFRRARIPMLDDPETIQREGAPIIADAIDVYRIVMTAL